MSYDLHFIKNKNLTILQALDSLEKKSVSNEFQFSESETKNIVSEITRMNQHSAINNNGTSTEIEFDLFKISLFQNQLSISIPFVKENLSQKTSVQVNSIIDIFLENGCVGLDGQIEKFIDDDYSFKTSFAQSLNVVTASKETDVVSRDFESKAAAEVYFFKERDKLLSLIDSLKAVYPKKKLDYSPESLKNLEWIFYEGLDNEEFGKTLPEKEVFYKLLSMYKAKVFVEQKAYEWRICENFHHKSLQLAIQTKDKMHTIFISPRKDFEDFPDGKKQALLKEYMRDV